MTMMDFTDRDIATCFVSARKNAQCLTSYPGVVPQSLSDAYAIQDRAIAAFGGTICGWKVGRINAPLCDTFGTTRLFGPAWADARQEALPGQMSVGRIFKGGFGAAEAEYMFRIGEAPRVGQTRFSREDAANLVDAVFVGFEIASSPFSGINTMGPLVTVSDFGNNNGLLVGPEIPDWRTSALEDWAVESRADGQVVGSGQAGAFPGGPLESVRLLLENLVSRDHPIEPGLLVTTGAVTGVHEVKAGQRFEATFGDFATIACSIEYAQA